jgi:hypothetical protein
MAKQSKAKQSKGFGKPVHVAKSDIQSTQQLRKFAKNFENHPLSDRFVGAVINPKGMIRMSDVLEDFTEPYLAIVETHAEREKMFTLAVAAWNAALLPQSESDNMISQFLTSVPDQELATDGLKAILDSMVDRKLQYFDEIKRVIVKIELTNQGDTYHLSVASSDYKKIT